MKTAPAASAPRVLHVIPSISMHHGGPSVAMRLIERALLPVGIRSETVTTDDDGPGPRISRPAGACVEEEGAVRRYFKRSFRFYKVSFGLGRWIFKHVRDYDLIHIHALFSFSSTVAAWAARYAGVPYVIRPLGTLASYGVAARRPWLKRISLALVEGPILRNAAAIHFTSTMERDEALQLGVRFRSAVVPLATEPMPSGSPESLLEQFPALRGRRWTLYLSRLDPKKNVEGLLDAIKLCLPALGDTRWVIAGGGEAEYVATLKDRARILSIEDQVIWAGHLQGPSKSAALATAKLFVLPSFSENFGIAAAEALHAGLPVVLARGVALAESAAKAGAGISVSPEPQDIARAMRFYLEDEQARLAASENARTLAQAEYSLEAMGRGLASLYRGILGRSESAPIAPL